MTAEERVVWEQEFYDGRVRQSATLDPSSRAVTIREEGDGYSRSVVVEVTDLRKIVKAVMWA